MQQPNFLQKGDTVGIVSTARKLTKQDLQPALNLLETWGLNFVIGDTIGAEAYQFAGADELRIKDFQKMLDDPSIKAIWCARGGYGTVRIIDSLDFTAFLKNPKWIVGYSDVTVLHSHVHRLGVQTLHAQMPLEIEKKSEASAETLRKALFGEVYEIAFPASHPLNRLGKVEGQLVGGNLSILNSLCGSPSALDTKGKILFLEDLDEYLYHVDRMMQNLKRNGMLDGLSGLVIGGMTDMKDNAVPFGKTAEEIIFEAVKTFEFPVFIGCPVGHVFDNQCLPLGRIYQISFDNDSIILRIA